MSFFTNDLTDQYLMKVYDDLQKEQTTLMNSLKRENSNEEIKETDITKQLTIINSISINILKLRNLRKKIKNSLG
jgi:hypothetical protein